MNRSVILCAFALTGVIAFAALTSWLGFSNPEVIIMLGSAVSLAGLLIRPSRTRKRP